MARNSGKKNTGKKQERGRRKRVLPALLLAVLLLGGAFGWRDGGAGVTSLRKAQVYLPDLPAQFENTTLLYISDVNACSTSDAAACRRLLAKLQELNPDMLILGGDYSAPGLVDVLNGVAYGSSDDARAFIGGLGDFHAPLGKFAVTGEGDDPEALAPAFAASGVQLLSDACAKVDQDGASLIIAGLSDVSGGKTPYEEIGGYFSGDECVIAVAHNPSAYVGIRVAEARSGGAWADMVLCGHTLGGQIRLFGRTLREMPEEEARCIAGWHYADDLPMLVSQGLGCRGAKLRLGTRSEVWLITLKRQQTEILPLL